MNKRVRHVVEGFSTSEKVLGFLGEAYERAALGLFDPFKYEKYLYYRRVREENTEKQLERRRIRQALSTLVRAGRVIENKGKYRLTPSGWLKFSLVYASALKKVKKTKRKGKRQSMIVIFDIPEKQRNVRDHFRRLLYSLGFSLLQDSVFIGDNPDSFEFISKIVSNIDVRDQVKLLVVDRVL